jgi:flagellar basal body-associated protein FliL
MATTAAPENSVRNNLVSLLMIIIGAIIAAVTVLGLIAVLVNSSAKDTANSSDPKISYGSIGG